MLTLDELKAENAGAQPVEDDLIIDDTSEPEDTETDDEQAEPEGETQEEVEDWLKTDGQTSQAVPLAKHVELKHKLKARISEKDTELAQIRAELEALKSGTVQPQAAPQTAKPPRLSDFDFDEDKHAEAMAQYLAQIAESSHTKRHQVQQQEQQLNRMKQAVDEHYERAAELVSSGKVDATKYQQADHRVRVELANLYGNPEQGDAIADTMLARLGAGSEKIMVHLGVNPAALNELKTKLQSDPTGLDAMLYLGELKAKFNAQTNKLSKAPKPDTPLSGDVATGSLSASALAKGYQEAHKKGDTQKAFELKRAAKAKGVNTTTW